MLGLKGLIEPLPYRGKHRGRNKMIISYPKISDSTFKNLKALLVERNKLKKRDVTFSLVVLQANSLSLFYHRYVVFWSTRWLREVAQSWSVDNCCLIGKDCWVLHQVEHPKHEYTKNMQIEHGTRYSQFWIANQPSCTILHHSGSSIFAFWCYLLGHNALPEGCRYTNRGSLPRGTQQRSFGRSPERAGRSHCYLDAGSSITKESR